MKKTIIIITIAISIMTVGCDINSDINTSSTENISETRAFDSNIFYAITSESGYVSNWYEVNTQADGIFPDGVPFKVGKDESAYFTKEYKTILTFDTSSIPDDAIITWGSIDFSSQTSEDYNSFKGYKMDIAGPFGFGGSTYITGYDFYATAEVTDIYLEMDDGIYPMMHFSSGDKPLYINTKGKTQLRLYSYNENLAVTDFYSLSRTGNSVRLRLGWKY